MLLNFLGLLNNAIFYRLMQGSKQGPRACQSGCVAIAFPVAHAISGHVKTEHALQPCDLAHLRKAMQLRKKTAHA